MCWVELLDREYLFVFDNEGLKTYNRQWLINLMIEIKTVYEGEFTNRKTEQFRQVDRGIQQLLEVGVTEKLLDSEGTTNHEKAHIVGHVPGRGGRIIARVFVNKRRRIEGGEMQHEMDPIKTFFMGG